MADTDLAFDDLPTIVRNAWEVGQTIDLSGINAAAIEPKIRAKPGFGFVRLRENF